MPYYVYALIDPRTGEMFYVGKGIRRRAWQHEADVRAERHRNSRVAERVRAIHASGASPQVIKLADGLTESAALRLERDEIAARRTALCNIAPGARSGDERQRDWARDFIRRVKPLSKVLQEGRVSREFYLRLLREAASLFARPQPSTWTKTAAGWVGSF